ncbi:MAG: HAD-IIB family hydrolase [Parasporobacterium sp.]|nr:HAD-IIB family hydrolase [Parasporobacterium sp.]
MTRCSDKFVFLDIDGTIYEPWLGVPDSTKEAIDKLKKNGHHPVISTGRTKAMIFPRIKELDFDGILAGVGAYGEWSGETLFHEGLDPEDAFELVSNFELYGFNPFPEGVEFMYYDPKTCTDPEKTIKRIFSLEDGEIIKPYDRESSDVSKVSALFMDGADMEGFKKTLNGRYHAINHHNVLLETFRVGVTKGLGIRKLIDYLGADMENTFAYGDSFNDLEMLETVRYGVCMENGDPKLLARIPLHAKRIEEDGIYYSLKEFGLI